MLFVFHRSARAAAAVLGLMSVSASAEPLINNLAEPIRDVTILGTEDPDLVWAAQSFSTPRRVQIDSLLLPVGRLVDSPEIVAELRIGDDPLGPTISMLNLPPITAAFDVEPADFTPLSPVILEPGQKYWIVLYTVAGGSFGWSYADTNNWIGDGALLDYWYSFDSGGLWSSFGSDFPYMVDIEASALTCLADLNGDGLVDFSDYLEFLNLYDAEDPRVDFNMDGIIDFSDYLEFLNLYDAGCP